MSQKTQRITRMDRRKVYEVLRIYYTANKIKTISNTTRWCEQHTGWPVGVSPSQAKSIVLAYNSGGVVPSWKSLWRTLNSTFKEFYFKYGEWGARWPESTFSTNKSIQPELSVQQEKVEELSLADAEKRLMNLLEARWVGLEKQAADKREQIRLLQTEVEMLEREITGFVTVHDALMKKGIVLQD